MTNRKNKNGKTVLLVSIAFILMAAIVFVLVYALNKPGHDLTDLPSDPEVVLPDQGNQTKPESTDSETELQVDLVDYTVYDLQQIDFRFILAKVRVKANEATNIGLNHFKTSEQIVLDQVSEYVNELESKSLFLGKQNVWFELVSSQNNYLARIFIPVLNDELETITLESDFKGSQIMKFDLRNPAGTKEDLGYEAEDIISDGRTYQMKVSNAYQISDEFTRTYESGYTEAYLLPSTAEIHAFHVEAVSLWGDAVEIEEAWYQVSESNEQFEALNGQFSTLKYDNIVNSVITDKMSGYLFFVTLNPEKEPLTYNGTLMLKIKGVEHMIHVQVDLQ